MPAKSLDGIAAAIDVNLSTWCQKAAAVFPEKVDSRTVQGKHRRAHMQADLPAGISHPESRRRHAWRWAGRGEYVAFFTGGTCPIEQDGSESQSVRASVRDQEYLFAKKLNDPLL